MGKKQETCPKTITKQLRAQVFYRDSHCCQHPECPHPHRITKDLRVHHYDHNAHNNFRSNLVTICVDCHAKESGKYTKAKNVIAKQQERIQHWHEKQRALGLG